MKQAEFKVLVLGALPEADDLFERGAFTKDFPCQSVRVEDPAQFAEAATDPSVDLILIDVEPHGVEVLQKILARCPMRPMIMVADAGHGEVILTAKRLGLERYVMRLADESLNADLLAEELTFVLKRLSEPPSMEHPTVEELFRFAQYHNVRQPFFVVDRNRRLLYANAAGKDLVQAVHGCDVHQGDQYQSFPLTGASKESIGHLDEALQGHEVEVEHCYAQLPDGDRHREVLYQPVREIGGDVVGVSIACKNIGLRQQAERRLERQEEALWSFFDLVPLPLKIVRDDFVIHRANPSMARFLGYEDAEELEGTCLEDFLHPDDREKTRDALQKLFEGTTAYSHFECRYCRRDGETVWTNHVDFPLSGLEQVAPVSMVLVLSADITRQKEAEQRETQWMRMRAIGELAAGVAHDFNNVLAIVTTYSQLLRASLEKSDADEEVEYIDKILSAVERAVALTQQLLTFGRGDGDEKRPLDLNQHIHDLSTLLEHTVGSEIDIQTELAADLPEIEADPTQIDQVIMNLAINARDAMSEGGRLLMRTRRERVDAGLASRPAIPTGDFTVLEISDTGEGMDEFTQRHIFEPFFTTKSLHRGTGLGLATVYSIVKRGGGYIDVDSDVDEGTTFTLYFPACGPRQLNSPESPS